MNKIEQKVYDKYKREIVRIIKSKYKKKAYAEAKLKKIYLESGLDIRKEIKKIANQLYKTYIPAIEDEINIRLSEFENSDRFKQALKAENELNKRKLSCKSLKKYQEFEIHIGNTFLNYLHEEVNRNSDTEITKEEIKYILLSIFYKIIEYMKNGFRIKIGTTLKLWLTQRDVRVNLPDVDTRILEDRLIPKCELCSAFDYKLFQEINKDNEAIKNYYKAKTDRYLTLLQNKKK